MTSFKLLCLNCLYDECLLGDKTELCMGGKCKCECNEVKP